MADEKPITYQWGSGDICSLIISALEKMSKPIDALTMEDLAPVDHYHARGLPATIELADRLPFKAGQHIVDIGCGLGGPARYIAKRFQCKVSGVDITEAFVEAANKLTALLHMEDQVQIREQALAQPNGSLRAIYKSLELPGKNPLRDAHEILNDAVLAAFGFSKKLDILSKLLDLNLQVADKIEHMRTVTGPGIPASYQSPAPLISEDCIGP